MFTELLTGSFWEYFLFHGLAEFCFCFCFFYIALVECVCHLVQELSASSPGVWHETPFTATSAPKLIFFIPISADEKGCYFLFRILASHLASFFFPPVTECKHLLAFILIWICYFGREELTYILFFLQRPAEVDPHSLFLFNGQSFADS